MDYSQLSPWLPWSWIIVNCHHGYHGLYSRLSPWIIQSVVTMVTMDYIVSGYHGLYSQFSPWFIQSVITIVTMYYTVSGHHCYNRQYSHVPPYLSQTMAPLYLPARDRYMYCL